MRRSEGGERPLGRGDTTLAVLPLRANRDFTVFWLAQALSNLGSSFSFVALPLLVLETTGSVAQMGLLTAAASVGALSTGLFAGMLADNVDRRRLMITCDLVRVVLMGLVPVLWLAGSQIWFLYVVMVLTSVCNTIFDVTYVTAVAGLVHSSQLVAANGRLQGTFGVANVLGPVVAGLVAAASGPAMAVGFDAASFAVSAAGLTMITLRMPADQKPMRGATWRDRRAEFFMGVVFLWRVPVLRWLTVLLSVITFLSLGLTDVFIYYLRSGLGQDDQVVGVVLALVSAGAVVGAVLAAPLRRSWGFGLCWTISYAICGVAVALLGMSEQVVVVALMATAFNLGTTLAGVCNMSLRQSMTPSHLLGRVTSAFWTIHGAAGPIGAAVLAALVQHVGVQTPLLVVGALYLVIVLAALATPIRQAHPENAPGLLTPADHC
ncbi:MFS transporter [Kutzneria albida]|uniref:Major facilitator superfamily (MFS) profile domain-containing protein n=1 Tax=Kutzneria albida DSM 43870 TaxID=1449976 RepID=W5WAC5_9PSEU|nr:MFS transporter [Kutzneria albida]AHH98098.1 hypothetical protein KALB_4736 [Kutzneria albida DSM 43870]